MGSKSRSKRRHILQLNSYISDSTVLNLSWLWEAKVQLFTFLKENQSNRLNEDSAFKSFSPYCPWYLLWKSIQAKVTTKEFETLIPTHELSGIPLKSQQRLILLTSLSAQLSFTHTNPTYGLSSQERKTSVHIGTDPQPGIARLYGHLAQAAEWQEAILNPNILFPDACADLLLRLCLWICEQ